MCGICGAFQIAGPPGAALDTGCLEAMTEAMVHRGPDDSGFHVGPGVALGARRLSVVDVEGGHQPFANEDGTVWAVQNGELYNHASLRGRLEHDGHRFRSRCDTEILPHMYEHRGDALVHDLRGMFAIAIWDASRRRGVLARDRLGVKPLYYTRSGDLLIFASELKSLLASGLVEPDLDHEAIAGYLTFGFTPAPLTPLRGVKKLMPGEMLTVADGGVRVARYWSYPEPAPDAGMSFEAAGEAVLEKLDESVRLRLMADVPVGAMLSGGLDSSLIAALMARNSSRAVETFSVGFRGVGAENELADAREVASLLGAEHHELELPLEDSAVDLAELVWFLDEPVADLSSLGFLALSQLAARHVTVALSGQGADELLGGYTKHRVAAACGQWERLPRPLRRSAERVALHGPSPLPRIARTLAARDPVERLLGMSARLAPQEIQSLYRREAAVDVGAAARAAVRARLGAARGNPLAVTLHIDGQLALVDDMLHYFDRASMAHSLEVRVPFLDHELVELCATVPTRHKVRGLQTKAVLKHAARGLVPDRIINKRKIGFFRGAVDDWFAAQATGAVEGYLLSGPLAVGSVLDERAVRGLVGDHVTGTRRTDPHFLLSLLMLEVWLSTYVPRARAARSTETARLPA